ncbi:MAG: AmmeMemoRadiSam system protein B [Nitrososphaerales archaeon]
MSLVAGVRPPAVAGLFYPGNRDVLFEQIHRCFTNPMGPGSFPINEASKKTTKKEKIFACFVVPHAGIVYSGAVAAHAYLKASSKISKMQERDLLAIIIGPNHYGIGSGVALSDSRAWETPLGLVRVNTEFSKKISHSSGIIDIDEMSHSREHSIEVQLPFLQTIIGISGKSLEIVPICMMLQNRETAEQVSTAILSTMKKHNQRDMLILGSSDLTHYEPHDQASSKDRNLLEAIRNLDVLELFTVLERQNISACGYGAIATVMYVAKELGKKSGNLLKYATSGDVTGDMASVVGYSAVEFE